MINITPTFSYQLYELYRGNPGGKDTRIYIPYLKKDGKKITATYKQKAYLPNSVFPVELYEYRRKSEIKLALDGSVKSDFANHNLQKNIYVNDEMKTRVSDLIDMCRQNMNKELEQELDDEIHLQESMNDEFDSKSLEYHFDLYETVKSFNDYLCIVFLNLCNILQYPNEAFYEKYEKRSIRIKPDDAMKMANKICARMQKEFEEIILENFPIRETVERISKAERNTNIDFDVRDIPVETKSKSKSIKKYKEEK